MERGACYCMDKTILPISLAHTNTKDSISFTWTWTLCLGSEYVSTISPGFLSKTPVSVWEFLKEGTNHWCWFDLTVQGFKDNTVVSTSFPSLNVKLLKIQDVGLFTTLRAWQEPFRCHYNYPQSYISQDLTSCCWWMDEAFYLSRKQPLQCYKGK